MDRNHYNTALNTLRGQIMYFESLREHGLYERRISALTYTYNTLKSLGDEIGLTD